MYTVRTVKRIDMDSVEVADYTLFIRGLPEDASEDEASAQTSTHSIVSHVYRYELAAMCERHACYSVAIQVRGYFQGQGFAVREVALVPKIMEVWDNTTAKARKIRDIEELEAQLELRASE